MCYVVALIPDTSAQPTLVSVLDLKPTPVRIAFSILNMHMYKVRPYYQQTNVFRSCYSVEALLAELLLRVGLVSPPDLIRRVTCYTRSNIHAGWGLWTRLNPLLTEVLLTVLQHCNMIEMHIIHWFPDSMASLYTCACLRYWKRSALDYQSEQMLGWLF